MRKVSLAEKQTLSALVVGGETNAGPPLGPALGPLGVNVTQIVNEINKKTGDYSGMRVPVKIHVNLEDKSFEVEVGIPTTSALIAKETAVKKGSGTPNTDYVGNISMENIVKIARVKKEKSYGDTIRSVAREIMGSCVSMGIKVEEMTAKEALKEMDSGKWSDLLKEDEAVEERP